MSCVLVTGAAGFLGSHLCDSLLKEGHEVVGIDNLVGGDISNVSLKVDFSTVDCRNRLSITELCKRIDVVYHCAAYPHEGLSVFSPVTVTRSVYDATVVAATAAIMAGVKRFVFTSSMSRYGARDDMPFYEWMDCNPVDPYGIAKLAAENTLRCLGKAHGMEVVIAVPHNIYGPRQRFSDPYRNVAAIMINRILLGKQPIIYGDGKQRRCFSYVDDCIPCLLKMGFQGGLDGEVINIGPDEGTVTINQLAATICGLLNKEYKPEYFPDRPCEVKHAWCNARKARQLLDYKTTWTLDAGLRSMIEWIKERGPKEFQYHLPLEIVSDKTPRTWKERLM